MSPKQKAITAAWCAITMVVTMILSHGHLVMREIMTNWPATNSWEGRLENALYTQGGLVLVASLVISGSLLIRGYLSKLKEAEVARKELAQRERHERATGKRHDALLTALANLNEGRESELQPQRGVNSVKKHSTSGARPK